jgi:hypothetical protein
MNKKGEGDFDERIIIWTFYFVILVAVFIYMWGQVSDQYTLEKYDKELAVKDLSLVIDSLHPSYGDYSLKYSLKESYVVSFNDYIGNVGGRKQRFYNDFNLNVQTDHLEINHGI